MWTCSNVKSISYTYKRITFIFINLSTYIHMHTHAQNASSLVRDFGWRLSFEITAAAAAADTTEYQVSRYLSFFCRHLSVCWIFGSIVCVCVFLCSYIIIIIILVCVVLCSGAQLYSFLVISHLLYMLFARFFLLHSDIFMMRSSLGRVLFSLDISSLALESFGIKKKKDKNNERIP